MVRNPQISLNYEKNNQIDLSSEFKSDYRPRLEYISFVFRFYDRLMRTVSLLFFFFLLLSFPYFSGSGTRSITCVCGSATGRIDRTDIENPTRSVKQKAPVGNDNLWCTDEREIIIADERKKKMTRGF